MLIKICTCRFFPKKYFRMALYEGTMALGMLSGTLSSSYMYSAIGYAGTYTSALACMVIAAIYIMFLIPESVRNEMDTKVKLL